MHGFPEVSSDWSHLFACVAEYVDMKTLFSMSSEYLGQIGYQVHGVKAWVKFSF